MAGLPKSWEPPVATKFAVTSNICGSLLWNLLHVTRLGPRLLRWLIEFGKFMHPWCMICTILLWAGPCESSGRWSLEIPHKARSYSVELLLNMRWNRTLRRQQCHLECGNIIWSTKNAWNGTITSVLETPIDWICWRFAVTWLRCWVGRKRIGRLLCLKEGWKEVDMVYFEVFCDIHWATWWSFNSPNLNSARTWSESRIFGYYGWIFSSFALRAPCECRETA